MKYKNERHFQAVRELVIAYKGKWPSSMTSGVIFWNGELVNIEDFVSLSRKLEFYDDTNN